MGPKGSIDIIRDIIFSDEETDKYYTFCIDNSKWDTFDAGFKLDIRNWRAVKFFQENGNVNPELKSVEEDAGVFMCLVKPDLARIPIVGYEYIMFIDGTTTSVRDALEDFIYTKSSSYLNVSEIRSLFKRYERYLYALYYIDRNKKHVEILKDKLIDLINPPIKNSKKAKKGSTENGF